MSNQINHSAEIYGLKVATLAAIELTFFKETEILVIKNPTQRRGYKSEVKVKRYEQANQVLAGLTRGITSKRRLGEMCGCNTADNFSSILKLLLKEGRIEDYHYNRYNVIPKNLKPFDLDILRYGMEWRQVKDIEIGDYIVCINPKVDRKPIVLDLAEFMPRFPATDRYVYTSGNMKIGSQTGYIYEWIEENGIPLFEYGGRKNFLEEKKWSVGEYDSAKNSFIKNSIVRIVRTLTITPEFAFAMGLYLAEASWATAGFYFSLNIKERLLFERAVNALREVVPNANSFFTQVAGTNAARGFFNNVAMGILLKKLLGVGAHTKHIPNFFANAPDDVLLRFLEAYAYGDGSSFVDVLSKSRKSNKKLQRVGFYSCNLEILLQVRLLLLRFGVIASIYMKKPQTSVISGKKVNTGVNYQLIIIGEQACKLSHLLWGHCEGEETGRTCKAAFFLGDYVCLRVQDIVMAKKLKIYSDLCGLCTRIIDNGG